MLTLIAGLILFLGVHSVRIYADDWRTRQQQKWGADAWRGIYAVLSLAGLVLVIYGFGLVRNEPVWIWIPPMGMRHAASLLNLFGFILLAAAYVPGNAIKARVYHPMVAGVKLWAVAHLMANGNLGHLVLFGSFLAWAVADFISARQRDRRNPPTSAPVTKLSATLITVVVGVVAWLVFAFWLHGLLIGIKPFG
ncbi:protein NrnU [Rhodoferax fermentans]|uniref:Protein NrnU n=2 Tax=Rhodoferax fermentans TaxID=28066 RepID=A0A1T1AYI5_RHOFE|nr:NnrU family protein [Rhodoferax fermentans]MBK1684243.1 protein NrnU [Rhodoferax fermentans]OOV09053.1 protein NrnU [Rhodoferax fermentans]